jgi:hypothetical protein
MNNLILCEGKTDAILISYYLKRTCGWVECRNNHNPNVDLDFKALEKNQYAYWYKRSNDYLLIFGVGGNANFGNAINEYILEVLNGYPEEESFNKVAIISDKDNSETDSVLDKHREYFNGIIVNAKENQWTKNSFLNSFEQKINIQTLSIVIPTNKQGALETVLLDAISEDAYDKVIVNKSKTFIDLIRKNAEKYISTDRLALKAHLSAVFAVMSPEKTFDFVDELMQSVEWEKYQVLKECFGELRKI